MPKTSAAEFVGSPEHVAAIDKVVAEARHTPKEVVPAAKSKREETLARRAALGERAWIVPMYDHPNPQAGNKRMQVGKAIDVELDSWAHNQIEAGFFTIVEAPKA